MTKRPNLGQITSPVFTVNQLNEAFVKIDTAFDNTLSRDGSTPNTMLADLDMNSNSLLNVDDIQAQTITVESAIIGGKEFVGTITWRASWLTGTAYDYLDVVNKDGVLYICLEAHTSDVFMTDLTNTKWEVFISNTTGPTGDPGADGTDGQGVPVGGTAGQVLAKIDGTDYNTEWVDVSGGAGITDGDKGDITVSASGATWIIDNNVVTLAKMADMVTSSLIYRKTAGSGAPEVNTLATLKTDLGLTGTNSGDQTSIVGITGSKAQFDTAVTDGNFMYVGDAPTSHTHTLANVTDVTITVTNLNTLDDGANTTLHFHNTDRDRANHTGTQLSTTISDSTAAGRDMLTAASATVQTALLDTFTSGAKGLVPASGGGTTNFLRADGTFAAPPGGGGSGDVVGPGSATDNALARFDTTTGKLIQNSVNPVSDAGEIGFPAVASPATPASGTVNLYGTDAFGPTRLGFKGPDGKLRLLQNDLGEFSVQRFQPAAGLATLVGENSINAVLTGTGTSAGAAITNLHTMKPRLDVLVTTASTTAIAAIRPNGSGARMVRVGRDANAPGGFLARFVWGPATGVSNASHRAFCGLDGTTNVPTDVENSGLTTGIVGMGWDAADANIQIMHNDLSGAATKIDLGASFPVPTTDRSEVYELQLFSPNSLTQSVSYRVIRYDKTDNTIAAEATGTITTNLPPVGTLLAPAVRMSVGGVSSVVGIACMGILIGREY